MSIFDTELKSQKIREKLSKVLSNKLKLLLLSEFLISIIDQRNDQIFLSYYIEFEPELCTLILKSEFNYCSPDELNKLIKVLDFFRSNEPFSAKKEKYDNLLSLLNAQKEKMLILLGEGEKNFNDEYNLNKNKSFSNAINIVLIEQDDDFNSHLSSGTIEKFKIESSLKQKDSTPDKITFSNITDISNNEILQQLNESAILAKVKCRNEGIKVHTYNFIFSFERIDCIYTGKSLGVGAAALAYNSILINELHKIYYTFKDDVVFTSEVDKYGNLLKLDEKSLRIKLQTIFYSPYKKFVIPEDNIVEAKKELAILIEKYPHRKLELIPIKNFERVFKNLDIVEICLLSIRQKIKANYREYSTTINWALSILSLLIILFFITIYLIQRLDRNPVNVGIENDKYVAYNKYGIKVWESGILNKEEINIEQQRMFIADVDDDGRNEILLLRKNPDNPLLSKTVFCYNSDNSLKWKTIFIPKDSLYGNEICYDRVDLQNILVIENKVTRQKEIIVDYTICDLFPYFVTKLDYKGKEISSFYNPGNTVFVRLLDLDNNGKDELVIGGSNNDFNHRGCLIVLDPKFIDGKAPGYRFPRGFGRGLMKYYVLLPKTLLNRFSDEQTSHISDIHKSNAKIIVVLNESFGPKPENSWYRVIFNFDFQFNFLHLQTSTEFDTFYKNLIEKGRIKPIKDWKAYEDSLRKEIKFWDGDEFVNHPGMNKYYLKAKTQQNLKTAKN